MMSKRSSQSRALPLSVAVSLWLYRKLLSLHPQAFRREFGMSIVQVFAQECRDAHGVAGAGGVLRLWLPAFGDLLAGACAERLVLLAAWWKGSDPMQVYRQSASMIFAAFVAYVLAGIGFQKMSEDVVKSTLPQTHPLLAVSYIAVEAGAVVALLAVLAGGVPIALATLRYAIAHDRRDILWRFVVPPLSLAVFLAYLVVLVRVTPRNGTPPTLQTPGQLALVSSLIAVFVLAAIASTAAVLGAIARSDVDPRLYRFSRIPGVVATLAMLLTLIALATWSFALWQFAPSIFFGNDGALATSTIVSIIVETVVMLGATAVAIRASLRSLAERDAVMAA